MSNYEIYNTAIYLRLSRDDGTEKESESIQNQKMFLTKYVIENGFNLIDTYTDDGYSGTNFNRPEFQRMLEDIESGRINCVITKDLSRLGRDYIMTGHYIEKYFPQHNVRYIAVNDGIDTFEDSTNNDMTPFKSVLNDMYAKDISKKVRTALQSKKESGLYAGSMPPYGYKIDPLNKGHLIIDETTAPIVRRIYDMYLNGTMKLGIANRLSEENIPTPSQVKNININQRFKGVWNEVIIGQILTNPTYAGHMAQGKYKKINYKLKTKVNLPMDKWIIIPNTHEPIISQEVFDMVQTIYKTKSYSAQKSAPHLLSGIVRCGDCKSPMTYTTNSGIVYMVCRTWKNHPRLKLCTSHSIREDFVNNTVIQALREQAEKYINKDKVIDKAMQETDNVEDIRHQLDMYGGRLEEIKEIISNLYMDKLKGIVSETDFLNMSNQFNRERECIAREMEVLQQRYEETEETKERREHIEKLLKEFLSFENIERNTLLQFVTGVEVYKGKEIKVTFSFRI